MAATLDHFKDVGVGKRASMRERKREGERDRVGGRKREAETKVGERERKSHGV